MGAPSLTGGEIAASDRDPALRGTGTLTPVRSPSSTYEETVASDCDPSPGDRETSVSVRNPAVGVRDPLTPDCTPSREKTGNFCRVAAGTPAGFLRKDLPHPNPLPKEREREHAAVKMRIILRVCCSMAKLKKLRTRRRSSYHQGRPPRSLSSGERAGVRADFISEFMAPPARRQRSREVQREESAAAGFLAVQVVAARASTFGCAA